MSTQRSLFTTLTLLLLKGEGEKDMLPTPSTSHVSFDRIYEPAEDSYLLLDTLSSPSEEAFLQERFNGSPAIGSQSSSPLIVEIGTGSGVVLTFVHANAEILFGRTDILTAGVDVNRYACEATTATVRIAEQEQKDAVKISHGLYLGNAVADLTSCWKAGVVDVLIFNPPYVPTPELPQLPSENAKAEGRTTFEEDSHLLSLSYAGGEDGMESTNQLLERLPTVLDAERGCAYILLCAQNKPEEVKERIKAWGRDWKVETVGSSGKKAGWEKLQIVRIWRERKALK